MSDNLFQHQVKIFDAFTPEILGAIWITQKELSNKSYGFNELNYLFDGLISLCLYGNETQINKDLKNTFYTHNFGKILFLIQTVDGPRAQELMSDHLELVKQQKAEDRRKILIIDENNRGYTAIFQRLYPQYIFEKIELSPL